MKLRRSRAVKRGRIEIIPMVDVMFFLLATFMMASLSMQQLRSLPVRLPEGQAASEARRTPVTLTVTHDGRVLVDEHPVAIEAIAGELRERLSASSGDVAVNADARAPHGLVTQAMLHAREAGARQLLILLKHAP